MIEEAVASSLLFAEKSCWECSKTGGKRHCIREGGKTAARPSRRCPQGKTGKGYPRQAGCAIIKVEKHSRKGLFGSIWQGRYWDETDEEAAFGAAYRRAGGADGGCCWDGRRRVQLCHPRTDGGQGGERRQLRLWCPLAGRGSNDRGKRKKLLLPGSECPADPAARWEGE